MQPLERGNHAIDEAKIVGGERGLHASRARVQDSGIEDAVAIEKDGGPGSFADSHRSERGLTEDGSGRFARGNDAESRAERRVAMKFPEPSVG